MVKSIQETLEELSESTLGLETFQAQQFVFETPLYEPQRSDELNSISALFGDGTTKIDGFCHVCGRQSVFHSIRTIEGDYPPRKGTVNEIRNIYFACQRDTTHLIVPVLHIEAASRFTITNSFEAVGKEEFACRIEKIGQSPSHADIANGELKEFAKIMEDVDRREFIRANGLAAHGVNIGAFVYLRRVFERLVDRARDRAGEQIDLEVFRTSRMSEKIDLLKDNVPDFMIANKEVYSALSIGIHELEEDKCGALYEILKASCVLMIEKEKELLEKRKKESDLSKAIKSFGKLNKGT